MDNPCIHFAYEPVIREEQLLFKKADFDSFVLICRTLNGFKVHDYLTIKTGNQHYSLEFKQKKSVHFLIDNESEKFSDFNFFESLFGTFGSFSGTALKTIFKFRKDVKFEVNVFKLFFENVVKESAVKLFENRDPSNSVSKMMFVKHKFSNDADLEMEVIRINSNCWTDYLTIFNEKLSVFKEKNNVHDIYFYVAEHDIRSDVELRKMFLHKYLGVEKEMIIAQFHIAIEVIDANYVNSFVSKKQCSHTTTKDIVVDDEHDNINAGQDVEAERIDKQPEEEEEKCEEMKNVQGSVLLFSFSNLPSSSKICRYSGISKLKDFGNFSFNIDNAFRKKFVIEEQHYLERDQHNFKFDSSISYMISYNVIYKICPDMKKNVLSFCNITNNFGYIPQIELNTYSFMIDYNEDKDEERHQNPVNFSIQEKENFRNSVGRLKSFLTSQARSDKILYKIKNETLENLDFLNLDKNRNVSHLLSVLAANCTSFIEQLRYLKNKIFHEHDDIHSDLKHNVNNVCKNDIDENDIIMDIDYDYENCNYSYNDNCTDNDYNEDNDVDDCDDIYITEEKTNSFATTRFETVYTFKKLVDAEKWIDADPLFEKQKCTCIKFLLSKDIINDDAAFDGVTINDCDDFDDDKNATHVARFFIVGSNKNAVTGNSQWTQFLQNNISEPIDSLIHLQKKMKTNVEKRCICTVKDALLTFVNQEKLQYIIHGENYNFNLISMMATDGGLTGFSKNDDLKIWRASAEHFIDSNEINLYDILYSETGFIQLNKFQKMYSTVFKVILNLLKKADEVETNFKSEVDKQYHFIDFLLKGHAIYALHVASLFNVNFKNEQANSKLYKNSTADIFNVNFLFRTGKLKMKNKTLKQKQFTHISELIILKDSIKPVTVVELLNNPMTNQSQLLRSSLGPLVGLDGSSKKMKVDVINNILSFIEQHVEYWPSIYCYENGSYENTFFKIYKTKSTPSLDLLSSGDFNSSNQFLPSASITTTGAANAALAEVVDSSTALSGSTGSTALSVTEEKHSKFNEDIYNVEEQSNTLLQFIQCFHSANSTINAPTKSLTNIYKSIILIDIETTDFKYKDVTEICLIELSTTKLQEFRDSLRCRNFFKNPLKISELQPICEYHKMVSYYKPNSSITHQASIISKISNNGIKNFSHFTRDNGLEMINFFNVAQQPTLLVGYNSNKFDIPIIERLLRQHELRFPNQLQSMDLYSCLKNNGNEIELINGRCIKLSNLKLETIRNYLFLNMSTIISEYGCSHAAENDCITTLGLMSALSDKTLQLAVEKIVEIDSIPLLNVIPLNNEQFKIEMDLYQTYSNQFLLNLSQNNQQLDSKTDFIFFVIERKQQQQQKQHQFTFIVQIVHHKIMKHALNDVKKSDNDILEEQLMYSNIPETLKMSKKIIKFVNNNEEFVSRIPRLIQKCFISTVKDGC